MIQEHRGALVELLETEASARAAHEASLEAGRVRAGGPPGLVPHFNISPTGQLVTVQAEAGGWEARMRRWGLIPSWAKDPAIGAKTFNARAETVAEKPSFRAAFKSRRCLIPVNGFYEWLAAGKTKTPFYISNPDPKEMLVFAGLWESWRGPSEEVQTCTIITTEANAFMQELHTRIPVILAPEAYSKVFQLLAAKVLADLNTLNVEARILLWFLPQRAFAPMYSSGWIRCHQGLLGEATNVSRQSINKALTTLEERGYIEHQGNRSQIWRIKHELCLRGNLHEYLLRPHDERPNHIWDPWSPDQRKQYSKKKGPVIGTDEEGQTLCS